MWATRIILILLSVSILVIIIRTYLEVKKNFARLQESNQRIIEIHEESETTKKIREDFGNNS